MEHAKDWPKSVAKQVGERIAYFRDRAKDERGRKLTAQALADKCTDLGFPIGRPAIAKLERGLRDTVTVAELEVIARALAVSPADLMFPVGQAADVEVLPGQHMDTWDAVLWWSGFAPRPGRVPPASEAGLVHLYQLHHVILQEWPAPYQAWTDDPGNQQYREAWAASERMAITSLRTVRDAMREQGLVLPDLPPGLAHRIGNGEAAAQ